MSDGTPNHILPRIIDPRRFCQQGVVLRGVVATDALTRLAENGVTVDSVYAELTFSVDEQRERIVTGTLAVNVQVQCQRCLEPMPLALDCAVSVAIVWDEESSRALAESYDPWIVASEDADLYALVEEEILLGLPFVSYHDFPCGERQAESEPEEQSGSKKQNPFQVLQQLKSQMKQ